MSRLTKEREQEIRSFAIYSPETIYVIELLSEIYALRAELTYDPYVSKANYLEIVKDRDHFKAVWEDAHVMIADLEKERDDYKRKVEHELITASHFEDERDRLRDECKSRHEEYRNLMNAYEKERGQLNDIIANQEFLLEGAQKEIEELKAARAVHNDFLNGPYFQLQAENQSLKGEVVTLIIKLNASLNVEENLRELDTALRSALDALSEERDQLRADKFKVECEATGHWKDKNILFEENQRLKAELEKAHEEFRKDNTRYYEDAETLMKLRERRIWLGRDAEMENQCLCSNGLINSVCPIHRLVHL